MTPAARRWYYASAAITAIYIAMAALYPRGYGLTVFGDFTQQALLAIALVFMARRLFASSGRERKFWAFMTFGAALWCLSEIEWVWYEVFLRADVPDPSFGDVPLFIHTVPIMGALALAPHLGEESSDLHTDSLDLLLLLLWWVFLYAFVVMAWQFAPVTNIALAGRYYSMLYLAENSVMTLGALALWWRARGAWKTTYSVIALSGLSYALCSIVVNRQIFLHEYYTGSYYDILLIVSICLFAGAALQEKTAPEGEVEHAPVGAARFWPTTLAGIAVISIPALALWTRYVSTAPAPVIRFRVTVSLISVALLTAVVFLRQHLLNRELQRLLMESRRAYVDLERMQDHLVHSEKLAALGHLVAGAAHEINNPLTAILGYSELLAGDQLLPAQPRSLAEKIGHQARRTKRLVANMLSFAQQQPASRAPVQVNMLLNNVLQLREPDLAGKKIRVNSSLDLDLPEVFGDGNHLLQVFLHIVNNAVDALTEYGGGTLTVATRVEAERIAIEFSDTGPGVKDPSRIFDPFYTTKPVGKGTGLGLSVCYGVVRDHGGEIYCRNAEPHGATFLIRLPVHKGEPAAEPRVATTGKS